MFTLFDTSAIDDGDAISSATLSIFGKALGVAFSQSVVATNSNPASNTDLVAGDFTDHTTDMTTEVASNRIAFADFSTVAYNDFTVNATGLTLISKTAVTKFGFRTSADFDNVEPTWSSGGNADAFAHTADAAGTANDPQLVVVHAVAAAVSAPVTDEAIFFD